MITTLSTPSAHDRRSIISADGAAWRIKPEVRTLSQIIQVTVFVTAMHKLTIRPAEMPICRWHGRCMYTVGADSTHLGD